MELSRIKPVFRFSLLTLFIAIAAVSVLLAIAVKRVHDQRATIAWAIETGGEARYDFEFDAQGFAIGHYDEDRQWIFDAVPPGPGWLRRAVGVDFFASIAGVSIRGKETSDLSRLTHLPRLQGLNVRDTSIQDLSPLAELTDLRQLWIGETPVADLSALAHLKKLELIYLRNTQITDISPLMHLDKLKGLFLNGAAVPPGDINRLRRALPNCHIVP